VKTIPPYVISIIIGITLVLYVPQIAIGQPNTSFIPYTNNELGFTVEYPSTWIVSAAPSSPFVFIDAPEVDAHFWIKVNQSEMQTLKEIADKTVNDLTNVEVNTPYMLVEVNTANYYLAGHRAAKVIAVGTPLNGTYEEKWVNIQAFIDGKLYEVLSIAKSAQYPEFEPIFQHMLESFRKL
jgi:PsbP